jgi:2-aminoethylphosphonate transport system substrate-binding protein
MRFISTGLAVVFALAAAPAFAQSQVVTVYAGDGLHDGSPNWFQTEFDAFTTATGIKVQYVEDGDGVIVNRVAAQKNNQQADVLVTQPPFIQVAAAEDLLAPYVPKNAAPYIPAAMLDPQDLYWPIVNDYYAFIYDKAALSAPPATFAEFLAPSLKDKIQYSTPGEAGAGTYMMLDSFHVFGSKAAGFAYLRKLQVNNVGPSPSTGRLTALVNKGEIYVSNGDLQMNRSQMADNPNIRIFFPEGPNGVRTTIATPYDIGLVENGPHPEAAKKLIDFLLRRQAQMKVSAIAEGYPVRTDVHPTDANYAALEAALKGVKVWYPDWSQVAATLSHDVATWHQVTGS